jgi:hypothetical protein
MSALIYVDLKYVPEPKARYELSDRRTRHAG